MSKKKKKARARVAPNSDDRQKEDDVTVKSIAVSGIIFDSSLVMRPIKLIELLLDSIVFDFTSNIVSLFSLCIYVYMCVLLVCCVPFSSYIYLAEYGQNTLIK